MNIWKTSYMYVLITIESGHQSTCIHFNNYRWARVYIYTSDILVFSIWKTNMNASLIPIAYYWLSITGMEINILHHLMPYVFVCTWMWCIVCSLSFILTLSKMQLCPMKIVSKGKKSHQSNTEISCFPKDMNVNIKLAIWND